jgi:shikimate kinase
MIHLVGPGGAGKSTIGVLLAERLELPFVDLDKCFTHRHGDISEYLKRCSYDTYAEQNAEVYRFVAADAGVIAMSSGFMTYPDRIHPHYVAIRDSIAASPMTFVLLPSFDLETCVAEIVRRQVQRPFGLVGSREETKIRTRFPIFMSLPARTVETMRPPDEIVAEILNAVRSQNPHAMPARQSSFDLARNRL